MVGGFDLDHLAEPIRQPIDRMEGEADALRRLWMMVHCLGQVLRLTSITLLVARDDDDPLPTDTLIRLNRPSLGTWVALIRELSQAPSSSTTVRRLRASVDRACRDDEPAIAAVDSLLRFRNRLAHGAEPPTPALAAEMYETNLPSLRQLIRSWSFLSNLSIHPEQYHPRASRSAGLSVEIEDQMFAAGPLLLPAPHTADDIEQDTALGASRPTDALLFDGFDGRDALYAGTTGQVRVPSGQAQVATRLKGTPGPEVLPERLHPAVLAMIASTESALSSRASGTYERATYVSRPQFERLIQAFLERDHRRRALVVTAPSGAGKSSLLCAVAEVHTADEARGWVPVLLAGSELDRGSGSLGRRFAEAAGLAEAAWDHMLATLTESGACGGTGVLLMLDALNEAPDPVELLAEVNEVVAAARATSWMRVLVTVRDTSLRACLRKLEESGRTFPEYPRAFVRQHDQTGEMSPFIAIPNLDEHQAKLLYEKRQEASRKRHDVAAPSTPFGDLGHSLRDALRQPILLRFLAETFDRRPVPAGLGTVDLYARFIGDHLPSGVHEDLAALARAMVERRTSTLPLAAAQAVLPPTVVTGPHLVLSPIERLLELGVIETADSGMSFVHQRLLEFVLARELAADAVTGLDLDTVKRRVIQPAIEEELGAISLLLVEELRRGQLTGRPLYRLLTDRVCSEVAERALRELRESAPDAAEAVRSHVTSDLETPELLALLDVYRRSADRPADVGRQCW